MLKVGEQKLFSMTTANSANKTHDLLEKRRARRALLELAHWLIFLQQAFTRRLSYRKAKTPGRARRALLFNLTQSLARMARP